MEMTQEWIHQYNKKCAVFLGWKNKGMVNLELWVPTEHRHGIMTSDLKFHSDWNWIHEVLDKIDTIGQCGWMKNHAVIFVDGKTISLVSVKQFKRKEAVIQAMNQFIDWYNKQKEL